VSAAPRKTRFRETRNQPTPFVQAGGQSEGAEALATETQPQFSTSMPRAMTEPAATMNTTSMRATTSADSRFQTPAIRRSPATSSTQGSVTATRFDATGPTTCHW
jgi:hypothetical protein